MDRLTLAHQICVKNKLSIDYGYQFIEWAMNDGVCTSSSSGITYFIRLDPKFA